MILCYHDKDIKELKIYFNSVIDWASVVFTDIKNEMCGLEWGRLYEEYYKNSYNPKDVSSKVQNLYVDPYIKNRKGIFEFILGNEKNTKLLNVRVFDDATKNSIYITQTDKAKSQGISNCPHCAMGHAANKSKIWMLKEMEADHVTAWSKGGLTEPKNCEMLCKTHNGAKGNR